MIYFHPLFIILSFISVLTATFRNIIIFTSIILIHELGHFFVAKLLGWKVDKIVIYPYGGCTKFVDSLNKPIFSEFLVLIFGPIFQIIFYLIMSRYLGNFDLLLFKKYNLFILLFNLLPIYPLDGGRLINLLISKKVPYLKSLTLTIIISFIVFFIAIFLYRSYVYMFIMLFLLVKVIDEFKKRKFYYNKFIVERYLYNYKFSNTVVIDNMSNFYRDKNHIIKFGKWYKNEKEVLNEYFLKRL